MSQSCSARYGFLAAVFLLLAGCAAPANKTPAVRVIRVPAYVTHQTFPPGRPPPHPSYFPDLELGLCGASFLGFTEIGVEYPKLGWKTVEATVVSVSMTTKLVIDVWAMEGHEAQVLPHEETHRAISEHYYRDAEAIVRRLAQPLLGRKIRLTLREKTASLHDELGPLQEELLEAYRRETAGRCSFAQERFDVITDHGREPIATEVAMARAIAEEEAHWKGLTASANH
jgi:hypothetical protein